MILVTCLDFERRGIGELLAQLERLKAEWREAGRLDRSRPLPTMPRTIGIVTSRMGSVADNDSGGAYGYRMSKAAVNITGVSLARDLAERGISVALLHPGYVRTDMTGHSGHIDAEEAAAGLIQRMDELSPATTGTFWHANGETLPW